MSFTDLEDLETKETWEKGDIAICIQELPVYYSGPNPKLYETNEVIEVVRHSKYEKIIGLVFSAYYPSVYNAVLFVKRKLETEEVKESSYAQA